MSNEDKIRAAQEIAEYVSRILAPEIRAPFGTPTEIHAMTAIISKHLNPPEQACAQCGRPHASASTIVYADLGIDEIQER